MDPRERYNLELELIRQIIGITARRHRLAKTDEDDFASYAHMKILDNDFRIIRGFQGKSKFRTFMTVVIGRLFQDYRNHRWGKWRLSAEATRLGETAQLLETLMVRDQHTFEQAFEIMTTNHGMDVTREQLAALAVRLPMRLPRILISEDSAGPLESASHSDESLALEAWAALQEKVQTALTKVMEELETEDKAILGLLFHQGVKIVRIAQMLRLDQRKLYRRIEKILAKLRGNLEEMGIGAEQVTEVIGRTYGSVNINFEEIYENWNTAPSNNVGET